MLTQKDVQILLNIIANANIKGADAPVVVELIEKLKKMVEVKDEHGRQTDKAGD